MNEAASPPQLECSERDRFLERGRERSPFGRGEQCPRGIALLEQEIDRHLERCFVVTRSCDELPRGIDDPRRLRPELKGVAESVDLEHVTGHEQPRDGEPGAVHERAVRAAQVVGLDVTGRELLQRHVPTRDAPAVDHEVGLARAPDDQPRADGDDLAVLIDQERLAQNHQCFERRRILAAPSRSIISGKSA